MRYKIIFTNLDGTLTETISGDASPNGIWDMKIRFDVLDRIREEKPDFVFIVTNQGKIGEDLEREQKFRLKINYLGYSIMEYCGCKCWAEYCITDNEEDKYRKPNTGMLELLCEKYVGDDIDYIKKVSLMIGDEVDKKTAENFGIDYMNVDAFLGNLPDDTIHLKLDTTLSEKYLGDPHSKVVGGEDSIYVTTNYGVLKENGWLDDLRYRCKNDAYTETDLER